MWNVISFLRKSFSKKFVTRRSSFCPSILKWNKHCKLFWCLTKQKRDKLICLIVWKRDTYLVLVILMLFAFRTVFQAERGWKALKIPVEFTFRTLPEWLTLLNQKPPFFPPKRAKTRHQSLSLKKWPPMSFLIHFYCIFMWQFFLYQLKTAKNILILILFHDFSFKKLKIPQNLPAPKNFSRHTKVPNRHQPAK